MLPTNLGELWLSAHRSVVSQGNVVVSVGERPAQGLPCLVIAPHIELILPSEKPGERGAGAMYGFKHYEVRLRRSERLRYVVVRRLLMGIVIVALAIVLLAAYRAVT